MKNAVIAAVVAAVVASGTTYAAVRINGNTIIRHSIPANRLTRAAVRRFTSRPLPAAVARSVTSTIQYAAAVGVLTTGTDRVTAVASCPAGEVAVSGGYTLGAATKIATVTESSVTADRAGWEVTMVEATDQNVTVYAACAPG